MHPCCVKLTVLPTSFEVTLSAINGINQSEITEALAVWFVNPIHLGIIDSSIGITDEGSTLSCCFFKIIEVIDVVVHCGREINEAVNAIGTGTAKNEVAANVTPT